MNIPAPEILLYVLAILILIAGMARIRYERRFRRNWRADRDLQDLARRHAAYKRDARDW